MHLDPHVLHTAAVFAILTRLHQGDEKSAELLAKRVRVQAGEDIDGVSRADADGCANASPTRA